LMRGRHQSKPMDQLVKEAKHLAKNGTKELILIAQDLTYYGLDLYGKRVLAELLERLSDVEGIEWIRLQYAYPSGFPMDVLKVMRDRSNICNYLDIPLQHISDKLLKSMRRGITKQKTIDLIDSIHQTVPEIPIRTTLICGYPDENERESQELANWVKQTRFDRLGCFTYSHEENTHAFKLEDIIDQEIKEDRVAEIMDIQQQISLEINQSKIGKNFKVLIDRKDGDYFVGRTEFDSPEVDNEVLISASDNYGRIGDFVNVQIQRAEEFDLFGNII